MEDVDSDHVIKTKNSLIFPCECGMDALEVYPCDNSDGVVEFPKELELCIWYMGRRSSSLWYRLRHAWRILFHGPYRDQIILSSEQVKLLTSYLSDEFAKEE